MVNRVIRRPFGQLTISLDLDLDLDIIIDQLLSRNNTRYGVRGKSSKLDLCAPLSVRRNFVALVMPVVEYGSQFQSFAELGKYDQ